MNETSASRVEMPAAAAAPLRQLVWDAPVRVFHWLMVLAFAGAWLTAESEAWRLLHVTLGYTMAGLVLFRIVWGVVGTRHARFADFVRGPAAVLKYLRSLLSGRYESHTGHNPAGALAILALLALTLALAVTGWGAFNQTGGEWLEEAHELTANTMLALVAVHLLGVLVGSWKGRQNLVRPMVTGFKPGRPEDGVRSAWRSVAALMLVAVLGFWWLQWQDAPAGGLLAGAPAAHATVDDD